MMTPYELGVDGIELQASNALGHFALTLPLIPILKATAGLPNAHVRVVTVTSSGHRWATTETVDFTSVEGLNAEKCTPAQRYANSKLGVCLKLALYLLYSLYRRRTFTSPTSFRSDSRALIFDVFRSNPAE